MFAMIRSQSEFGGSTGFYSWRPRSHSRITLPYGYKISSLQLRIGKIFGKRPRPSCAISGAFELRFGGHSEEAYSRRCRGIMRCADGRGEKESGAIGEGDTLSITCGERTQFGGVQVGDGPVGETALRPVYHLIAAMRPEGDFGICGIGRPEKQIDHMFLPPIDQGRDRVSVQVVEATACDPSGIATMAAISR